MFYRLIADFLLVFHLSFIVFVLVGGFLAWRWRRLVWLHIPAAAWGAWIEFAGWICPLTPLENHFRRLAGQSGYQGGFIEHYIVPLIYPEEWTLSFRLVFGSLVVAINAAAYFGYFRFRRK
ncbi:MAG: hypothetical protein KatS3mg081_2192 [Gemmatimonadales bacterium]|nr:hypothetical protein HRbin33_01053 [bacterium HR33]GIW52837.1 MAG: hypothetical protein KatS3mg081_2192 [Gemmatimonadales bacterium]